MHNAEIIEVNLNRRWIFIAKVYTHITGLANNDIAFLQSLVNHTCTIFLGTGVYLDKAAIKKLKIAIKNNVI